ncbi:hypothetical protein HYU13_03750, partial [Candidatus Woesearchaeota archaeon]|nr:hypothetical protein [Candidatus Woesearchaeota archaeon]
MKGIAGTAGKIEIVRVKKSEDLLQFLTFPEQVYKNFKVWVEPVIADQLRFFSEKNPLWGYVSKTLLLAKKEGRIAGRISVFLNSHYIKFAKEKAAYFGFFESIRDQNVADLLFAEAQKEVIKKGMSILRGPINASTLYETGLLIQGFNEIPTTSTNFAPKYYSRLISKAGFHKAIDLNAFNINIPP